MTPGARAEAAIGILDRILGGEAAEKALTSWGRASRYAGSGDRAAVRDLVFDALRCKRSFAAWGGAETGRGLVLGRARARGLDAAAIFTGQDYGPAPIHPAEMGAEPAGWAALDIPDWLGPLFADALGDDAMAVLMALQSRAPVFLRVNLARLSRDDAIRSLGDEGIETAPHALASSALVVTAGERRIQGSRAYLDGLVELQDAASQAVVEALPLSAGNRVLDLCAGGGGKTLAIAARAQIQAFAHDAAPQRMRDVPARAARAGVAVTLTGAPETDGPYDLVLCDVPCSGAGSWRRDPEGKWRLTPARLAELTQLQAGILDRAAPMVVTGGNLAYVTCSVLQAENAGQVAEFLQRHPDWCVKMTRQYTPLEGGDGFFLAVLSRV